ALLDGRNLRLVEDVANPDLVGGDRQGRQVVDREVAEGMGVRRPGAKQNQNDSNERGPGDHDCASRNTRRDPGDSAAAPLTAAVRYRSASRSRPERRAAT